MLKLLALLEYVLDQMMRETSFFKLLTRNIRIANSGQYAIFTQLDLPKTVFTISNRS